MAKSAQQAAAEETDREEGDGLKDAEGYTMVGTLNYRKTGVDGKDVTKPGAPDKWPLCRMFGTASQVIVIEDPRKTGQTFFGLGGQFKAINLHTGEMFISGKCFLPSGIHEMVLDPLMKDKSSSVEFAFDLYSVRAPNMAGYSVMGKALQDLKLSEPMSALEKKLSAPVLFKPAGALTDQTAARK